MRGELLQRIERAGLKAFVDFRDFIRGAPSIREMERGVLKCRKTLVILTPEYITSGWAEIECGCPLPLCPLERGLDAPPCIRAGKGRRER